MALIAIGLGFVISLIISTIIIWLVAKLMGESEGIGTAFLAGLIGAVIFALVNFIFGNGLIAAFIAGIAWLIALGTLYRMGWAKAFIVALIIWIVASVVGYFLPTLSGPF
jgi:hypothetical protein